MEDLAQYNKSEENGNSTNVSNDKPMNMTETFNKQQALKVELQRQRAEKEIIK